MSIPKINARLEHVTRKSDRRKPEVTLRVPHVALSWSGENEGGNHFIDQDQIRVLRRALQQQLYRLEAERAEEMVRKGVVRSYVVRGIDEEMQASQQLLNAVEYAIKRTAGALTAGPMQAGQVAPCD